MKLGLGTVQFGLAYGINNTAGKPALRQIEETIQKAGECGINLLDTAADYGDSESNLGKAIPQGADFRIVTKTSKNGSPRDSLLTSLRHLNRDSVYGLLIHDFQQYSSRPRIWDEIRALKDQGLTSKAGFSLYLPEQLESILSLAPDFDLVQIPFSVFDQRFEQYLSELKARNIEIHVRSVFVQGLVFNQPDTLNPFFNPIISKLEELNTISKDSGKSIESLCLNFVNANPSIDNIIIGVDSKENLQHNVSALAEKLSAEERSRLSALQEDNEQMILPFNWKLK